TTPRVRPVPAFPRTTLDLERQFLQLSGRRVERLKLFARQATAVSIGHCNRTLLSLSLGVSHPRVSRGRPLRLSAAASRSASVNRRRLMPLGKYWRNRPLAFSLLPRCQGEWGSAKYTGTPVSI